MAVVSLLLFGGLWSAVGASNLAVVTCGSVVKLLNTRHNVRLHSHDVRYGSDEETDSQILNVLLRALHLVNDRDRVQSISVQVENLLQLLRAAITQCGRDRHVENYSSGQQSVTGVTSVDDSNSYWRIRGKTATVCERGTPIKCGQPIRLTHINTGRNLHSHHFTSPLSGNQEVSAFGEEGEGDYLDDWTVLCNGPYWVRDGEVRFKHSSTEVLLSVTGEQYGRPISGQKEVHGMAQPSQNNYWKAMEGIFMKPSELLKAEAHHAEL